MDHLPDTPREFWALPESARTPELYEAAVYAGLITPMAVPLEKQTQAVSLEYYLDPEPLYFG